MIKRLSKYIVLAALTFIGVSAKAELAKVYEIDYSTYTGFPFYVMGYVPEWFDGVMTDFGAMYTYKIEAEEGDNVVGEVQTHNGGATYKKIQLESPGWHQYFIADGIPTTKNGHYVVKAMVKASEPVTINVNMGWGWGSGESVSASVAIPTAWTEVEWEYEGIGGTSCNLVAQPGGETATIEWKYVRVFGDQSADPGEWQELLTNGDAETPWTAAQKAIAYNDMDKNFTICAWSKEKGRNMNEEGTAWNPFPADIEIVDGSHVFVVHGQPATSEGDASEWDNQFWIQSPKRLEVGSQFKLSFRYKASEAVNTHTQFHHQTPGDYLIWHAIGDINFTTEWQPFESIITVPDDAPDAWSIAFNLNPENKNAINFYFDDISLSIGESPYVEKTFIVDKIKYHTTSSETVEIVGHEELSGTTLTLPSTVVNDGITYTVTSIAEQGLASCSGIEKIEIPNSIVTIGYQAFVYNDITSFHFPASVKSIEDQVFNACEKLLSITVDTNNEYFCAESGVLFSKNKDILYCYPQGKTNVKYVIPNTVKTLATSAFRDNKSLKEINFPQSITECGWSPFEGCTNLKIIKADAEIPHEFDENIFETTTYSNARLYVPNGRISAYASRTPWKKFNQIYVNRTYNLIVTCGEHGSVTYESSTETYTVTKYQSIEVMNGEVVKLTFNPDNGYKLGELKVNGSDKLSQVEDNTYTISSMNRDINVVATFVESTVNYNLTITTQGNGSVTYGSSTVTNYQSFEVKEGSTVKLTFNPDNGYKLEKLTKNGTDVTRNVTDNTYTITKIKRDLAIVATFVESTGTFSIDGVNYSILSASEETVIVSKSIEYSGHLTIPETVNNSGVTWKVVGIADNAFNSCSDLITISLPQSMNANNMGISVFTGCTKLAAITWNADFALTLSSLGAVNNPNLLFYTKNRSYAPEGFSNVIVNGAAERIVLQDVATENDNFYCPTAFTAKEISYNHNYTMESAYGGVGGWETLALPFTVQQITHERAGNIVPFAAYDGEHCPFWLYTYSSSGFVRAGGIEANVPYIICMPNNNEYNAEYRLSGRVTFSAKNTKVATSDGTAPKEHPSRGNKTFVAAYKAKSRSKASDVYAMNVVNDLYSETGNYNPGSVFISNLRDVSPFEAVMTTNSAASHVIALEFGETTGIESLPAVHYRNYRVYNLNGQLLIQTESVVEKDQLLKQLPAGVYIVNGKKITIK